MDELFHVSERKSTIGTELRAGLTTFLAMAYIIAVNPAVLSGAGIDAGALACATCLGAGIMTICMGIFANRPLACASGLGVNAMIAGITTTVCGGDWHVAMSVIFLEGVVILLLVLCGLREAIMDAIPVVLRHAISVGLGLFNLVPVPPLDGSKVLLSVLSDRAYDWLMRYERYIMIALLAAVWFGALDTPLYYLNNIVWDLLGKGTGYIDKIAYSIYYAGLGTVV